MSASGRVASSRINLEDCRQALSLSDVISGAGRWVVGHRQRGRETWSWSLPAADRVKLYQLRDAGVISTVQIAMSEEVGNRDYALTAKYRRDQAVTRPVIEVSMRRLRHL